VSDNGRISFLFAANALLFLAIGELNHAVSGWALQLRMDVLLFVFFALYLNRLLGLLFAALLGLLAEAAHPGPQGAFLIGYLGMWLFLVWSRQRIRRHNPVHVRTVAAAAQALWLLALSLFIAAGPGAVDAGWWYWQRVGLDLLFSLAAVYLLAWPWCRFQKNLLVALGWDIEARISGG
jgi:hypothetical protein